MLEVEQTGEYRRWFDGLRDVRGRVAVARQVERIASAGALVGDWKQVGGGVTEVRIKGHGPGYRLYLSVEGGVVLLLLVGGDKSSQTRDIERARGLLREWRDGHGD